MSPSTALSLCIVFIAVLFLLDCRRKSQISAAIWLPTIWMMYAGSRPLAYWFESESLTMVSVDLQGGSPIDKAFLSVLIVLGTFVLLNRKPNWSRIRKDNLWIFLFFSFMALSILWSDLPAISFKRWIRTTGDLIMALVVLTESNSLEAIKTIFRRSAFVLLPLSIVLIKYFSNIGIQYSEDGLTSMWVGVTTQKNVLGYVTMVFGLYFVNNVMTTWRSKKVFVDVLFVMMALWLFLGSPSSKGSMTSVATLALGLGVLMATYWTAGDIKKLRKYTIIIALVLFFSVMTYETFFGSSFKAAMGGMGRDTTITGRTEIWSVALNVGPGNALIGRGYGSFWIGETAIAVWDRLTYHLHFTQSHNGYIDIYLELGVVGLTLLAWLIWSAYKNTGQTLVADVEYGALRIAFLSMILMHNITESSFGRPTHLLWFLFLLICTYVTSQPRLAERMGQTQNPRPWNSGS